MKFMIDVKKNRQRCKVITAFSVIIFLLFACKKNPTSPQPPNPPDQKSFTVTAKTIDSTTFNSTQTLRGININPSIRISFSDKVDRTTIPSAISFNNKTQNLNVAYTVSYQNSDSTIIISPSNNISYLNEYIFSASTLLQSVSGKFLTNRVDLNFFTQIDSSDKFSRISDSALLDLVQKQTFKYFWDFGHPVSGLARDRNTSGDVCTTGGTGFGVMSMIAAVNRNFISRADCLTRIQKIVSFLKNNCTRYHGAFAHWVNGATGATIPFSTRDDGADLVETSFLLQGLLCARQYFNTNDVAEINLRNDINDLWNGVEWNWFRQNNQNVLYWHWSPDNGWAINMPINGWDEALVAYVLAASSNTDSIPKIVYDNGWAKNGAIRNGNSYYGIQLPLGPDYGGPLFFAHYSFLGINPHNLSDAYANYWEQDTAHSKINYLYCVNNPKNFYGYSNACWGLTASDDDTKGYDAHSPTNDDGVITLTAAISSLPYTPTESMNALKFFYYTLGDKLWGDYGFVDAFNLTNLWYANSFLAIDQGPEIVMIENYRSGLLWNLFMSCPEIKRGMKALGFQSPYL
jgi:hypothetical protein